MFIELSYYIFEFDNHRDVDGLVLHHTDVIDGRMIITFRRRHWKIVPQHLNFDNAKILVRVVRAVRLPLGFLN